MGLGPVEKLRGPFLGRVFGASGTVRTRQTSAQIRGILASAGIKQPSIFSLTVHRIMGMETTQFENVIKLVHVIVAELNNRQENKLVDLEETLITLMLPPAKDWKSVDLPQLLTRLKPNSQPLDVLIKACFDSNLIEIDLSLVPKMVDQKVI